MLKISSAYKYWHICMCKHTHVCMHAYTENEKENKKENQWACTPLCKITFSYIIFPDHWDLHWKPFSGLFLPRWGWEWPELCLSCSHASGIPLVVSVITPGEKQGSLLFFFELMPQFAWLGFAFSGFVLLWLVAYLLLVFPCLYLFIVFIIL